MVVSSLIKNILPIAIVGLGLAFLYNVVAKPDKLHNQHQHYPIHYQALEQELPT